MKKASFGSRLRALREEKRLGLRELASKVGMSPGFLSKVESGKEKPPAEGKLRALANALDCDPEVLMALAGRLPADIIEIIRRHPSHYVALLRALRRSSAVQLKGLVVSLARRERPRPEPSVEQLIEIAKSFKNDQFPATLFTQKRVARTQAGGGELDPSEGWTKASRVGRKR